MNENRKAKKNKTETAADLIKVLIAAAPLNAELAMTKIILYAEKGDREKIYEMYSDYSKETPRLSKNIPGEIDDIIDAFSEGITKDGRKNLAYNSNWGGERGGGNFAISKYSTLMCFKNPIETP